MEHEILGRPLFEAECQVPLHSSSESDCRRFSDGKYDEYSTWLIKELSTQSRVAGPMILVSLLQFALTIVTLVFVGHLGELALSSSQIALTTAKATGLNIMMGLAVGLETLCGQAYGAKQYYLTGIFLQRGIFVLTLVGIPVSFLWWSIAPILVAVGQDPLIAEGAQEYTRFLIPTLFAYAFLQPLVKYMQAQSAVKAMALFSVFTLVIHVILCYFVIWHLEAGIRGAAIVTGISHWINVLFLALYVTFSGNFKKTWTGFSREAVKDIYPFLKLAVPSTFLLCLEYWCFDISVFLSGRLPNPQLETSTFSVCLNIIALLYMIPSGLSAAVSTRVSNELGAGLPDAAKAAVKLTVSLGLIEGCTVAIVLMSARNILPYLFINEPDVVNYVSSLVPLLAVAAPLDGYRGILYGVASGCGWQQLGAYSNLIAFYAIGLPVGLLLTFHFNYHGYGLWIGILSGFLAQTCLLSCITLTLNWQKLSFKAARLVDEARDHHEHILTTFVTKRQAHI
ncbi:hypothetical protein R1sor_024207 [Riccia sorocarpa]|uniref:Protein DETOXIFICATION n=1 Tax=Riccia sorocarpa TaxID=122646 RepID=A0ABD3GTY0_9MARC